MENKDLYYTGCPHRSDGRHQFEPRYHEIREPQTFGNLPVKVTRIYECDVCTECGITTTEINK